MIWYETREEAVCERKMRYATWAAAEADASRIAQGETPGLGGMLIPYRCADHWHNGHLPWKQIRVNGGGLPRKRFGAAKVRHSTGVIV